MKRVLIVCLSGLGDTLLASPALAALCASPSQFRLTLLTMFPSVTEYLVDQKFTEDVRFIDFLNISKWSVFMNARQLRREKFDMSVIPYAMNRLEYNLFSWFVGARLRIGFRYQRQRGLNLPVLNQCVIDENPDLHAVEENLRWAAILTSREARDFSDVLCYQTPPDAVCAANKFLQVHGLDRSEWLVGLHPGCNTLKNQQCRCWSAVRFAEFINRTSQIVPAVRFILFEGPQDKQMVETIQAQTKGVAVATLLPMRVVGALIRRCRLFVSNDSGLMHVASACKVPCVAIFGPTNPVWVHPWKTRAVVVSRHLPCSPCFNYSSRPLSCPARLDYACVRELAVEDVVKAALEMLQSDTG